MKKFIISLIVSIIAVFSLGACFIGKDSFVMYYGIIAYRSLQKTLLVIIGISCGTTVGCGVYQIKKNKDRLNEIAVKEYQVEEQKRMQIEMQAGLSVKGDLDPAYVKSCLYQLKIGAWGDLSPELDDCIHQFEQMDDYQKRFAKLLSDNGASTLSDTEDVIDQVEQYMCRNARSVINFMNVADNDAKEQVIEKLCKCQDENEGLLKQTRDFIYAMTEFLNDQGGTADTRLLESYKETLLKTVQKENI